MCLQSKARCVLNGSENLPVLLDTGDLPVQHNSNIFTLKVELFNARSIKNKLHDVHYLLNVTKPDVISITETWLNASISDNLLINNYSYSVFRKDREMSLK